MSQPRVLVDGEPEEPAADATVRWLDRQPGVAEVVIDGRATPVIVEAAGEDWVVTIAGRRIAVRVETARRRLLARESEAGTRSHGPTDIRATLPGLVVAVSVEVGQAVARGDRLMVIEAMKMQNEIRAPGDGVVSEVAIEAGRPVTAGALLIRIGPGPAVQSVPDDR